MPFSRNYHLIQYVGSANKRARTSAPAGDIHGSSILCRVADIAWPAVKTGPGDGRVLSWQHDRAGVRSATFVRVWGACRAESTRRAADGEFTKGEGRVKMTFFLDKFRGACYDPIIYDHHIKPTIFFYYVRLEILYEYRESTRVSFPSQFKRL